MPLAPTGHTYRDAERDLPSLCKQPTTPGAHVALGVGCNQAIPLGPHTHRRAPPLWTPCASCSLGLWGSRDGVEPLETAPAALDWSSCSGRRRNRKRTRFPFWAGVSAQVSPGRSWLGEGAVPRKSPGETRLPCIPAKNSPGRAAAQCRKDRMEFALNPEAAQQLGARKGREREARGLRSRRAPPPPPGCSWPAGAWKGEGVCAAAGSPEGWGGWGGVSVLLTGAQRLGERVSRTPRAPTSSEKCSVPAGHARLPLWSALLQRGRRPLGAPGTHRAEDCHFTDTPLCLLVHPKSWGAGVAQCRGISLEMRSTSCVSWGPAGSG